MERGEGVDTLMDREGDIGWVGWQSLRKGGQGNEGRSDRECGEQTVEAWKGRGGHGVAEERPARVRSSAVPIIFPQLLLPPRPTNKPAQPPMADAFTQGLGA